MSSNPRNPSTLTQGSNRVRIVVATSVALTFVSFWRAAAIVLNDLGSSAFYAGGIAEEAIGKAAPWFIIGVMLFSFAVRAVYVESCSMFVRGGVYKVVKEALGGTLAKISVSMLIFDYILTGPISGVSAGQYIVGLINSVLTAADKHGWIPRAIHESFGRPHLNEAWTSVAFAVLVTIFYWWENIKGIEESSEKALRVMQITTVMVVILMLWSGLTLLKLPSGSVQLPPLPTPSNLQFSKNALGFLSNIDVRYLGIFGVLIAFGHSILAMSGEETLAQVNREIAHPKLKNLKRAAIVIAIFSFIFTGIGTLLAVMLVPDEVRVPVYRDNLMSGLAMNLYGPIVLKLLFNGFVVFCGFLLLSGAVNTSIIGANGVLNRVSEDGVLHDWFRRPQRKYGTTYRIINLIVILQLLTILASRGDVITLGEAYAFGVIWSFTFNSLAMLVLRFKYKGERGWKVPLNIRIGTNPDGTPKEIPVGLASVHFVLLSVAVTNLFTKSIATKTGVVFALAFFTIFYFSERHNQRKHAMAQQDMKEHFQLEQETQVNREVLGIQPGNVLVTVRDYNTLGHLRWVLERIDTNEQDVVVLSARLTGPGAAEYELDTEQIFSDYEQKLFTETVKVAEKVGRTISLVVVPARDPFSAIIQTAMELESAAIVAGLSSKMTAEEQAYRLGQAWEAYAGKKRQIVFQVVKPDASVATFRIGPHAPDIKTEDVHLIHRIWLKMKKKPGMEDLHHHDILTHALTRYNRDWSRDPNEIENELRRGAGRRFGISPAPPKQLEPPKPGTEPYEGPDRRRTSVTDPSKDTFQGF
jgi:hypothetical protein